MSGFSVVCGSSGAAAARRSCGPSWFPAKVSTAARGGCPADWPAPRSGGPSGRCGWLWGASAGGSAGCPGIRSVSGGHRHERDGEMGADAVRFQVKDRPRPQVMPGYAEALLDFPEAIVPLQHPGRCLVGQVGDDAAQPDPRRRLRTCRWRITFNIQLLDGTPTTAEIDKPSKPCTHILFLSTRLPDVSIASTSCLNVSKKSRYIDIYCRCKQANPCPRKIARLAIHLIATSHRGQCQSNAEANAERNRTDSSSSGAELVPNLTADPPNCPTLVNKTPARPAEIIKASAWSKLQATR